MSLLVTMTDPTGPTTITLNGPRDSDPTGVPRYVLDTAAGGQVWSYKLAATIIDRWTMTLQSLTGAQKAALKNFFDNVVEGPSRTFTYTHTNGNSYTNVRFVDTFLKFKRSNANEWSVTITLLLTNKTIT